MTIKQKTTKKINLLDNLKKGLFGLTTLIGLTYIAFSFVVISYIKNIIESNLKNKISELNRQQITLSSDFYSQLICLIVFMLIFTGLFLYVYYLFLKKSINDPIENLISYLYREDLDQLKYLKDTPEEFLIIAQLFEKNIKYNSEIKSLYEKYYKIIDAIDSYIIQLDSSGKIILVNEAFIQGMGYLSDDLIGKKYLDFLYDHNNKDHELFIINNFDSSKNFISYVSKLKTKYGDSIEIIWKQFHAYKNGLKCGVTRVGKIVNNKI